VRILYITTASPVRSFGGGLRARAFCRGLGELGHTDLVLLGGKSFPAQEVERLEDEFQFIAHIPEPASTEVIFCGMNNRILRRLNTEALKDFHFKKIYYRHRNENSRRLRMLSAFENYDRIVVHQLPNASRLGLIGDRRLVLDIDDESIEELRSRLKLEHRFLPRMALHFRRKRETKIWDDSMARVMAMTVSNPELNAMEKYKRAIWVPNPAGAFRGEVVWDGKGSNRLLFVGSLYRRQVKEGLIHFLSNVWPTVLGRFPEMQLNIYGKSMPQSLLKMVEATRGVHFLGYAEDLEPLYAESLMSICPVYTGAGTNIKVIEALAFGCPVWTTEFGARGIRKACGGPIAHLESAPEGGESRSLCGFIERLRSESIDLNTGARQVAAAHSQESINHALSKVVMG
jgi:glycosyltransferase involved in cell wall biosynthesis